MSVLRIELGQEKHNTVCKSCAFTGKGCITGMLYM